MRFILRWKNRPAGVCVNPRQLRLGDLISRATRSSHYRDHELHFPPTSSWEDVPRHLEGMPKTALADFLANPGDFYNWNHSPRPLGPLECPVGNIGRIAVLETGFELSAGVDSFPYPTSDELEDFEPDSIAGPAASLRQLAEAALDGRLRLGSLRRAILAFTGLKHGCLKQSDRDLLWRAFRTPVFEQFRGFSQELLAWECEAHDGLHVEEENAIFETPRGGGEILLTSLDCTEYPRHSRRVTHFCSDRVTHQLVPAAVGKRQVEKALSSPLKAGDWVGLRAQTWVISRECRSRIFGP